MNEMLQWQYRELLSELGEIQRHASDPSCPCMQADKGEYCLTKHSLGVHTLARETAAMDKSQTAMLETVAEEALELHKALKDRIVCGQPHKDEADAVEWSRRWRKKLEEIYYHACKVTLKQDVAHDYSSWPVGHFGQLRPVTISGKCADKGTCAFKVARKDEVKVGAITELPKAVDKLLQACASLQMSKVQKEEWLKHQIPLESLCQGGVCVTKPQVEQKKYQLFPFQAEGVAWLKGRKFALLADEMGLGKTPQAILWGADLRPSLVVVPASLVYNWQREISDMWRPGDKVLILDADAATPDKPPDWTIVSYGQLAKYLPWLRRAGFQSIIVDEAHNVKNLEAQRTRNLLELVASRSPLPDDRPIPNRLAVTGTPILNRPIELFSLLVFLGVKKWSDYSSFMETYTESRLVQGRRVWTGARNLPDLHIKLREFMLRRKKDKVLTQLPPKIHTPMFVGITNAREYYEAERDFIGWVHREYGSEAAQRASAAELITRMNALRRLAALGKVEPVADWLKPCTDGQGKVLVFSNFTEPLENLAKLKPGQAKVYTGALSKEDRQDVVDKFQKEEDICYFLGTVGAAGVGITLTRANRVAFLDLPWTPGGKIQAEDRAHRIGQTKQVEIVNVLAKGTIDEKMLVLLKEKEFIINQAIDGKTKDEAMSSSISNLLLGQYLGMSAAALRMPPQYVAEPPDPAVDYAEILEGPSGVRLKQEYHIESIHSAAAKEPWMMSKREFSQNYREVYHGTPKDFKTFELPETGLLFFTEGSEYAKNYASKSGGQGRIISAALNIRNPLEIEDINFNEYTTVKQFTADLSEFGDLSVARAVKRVWRHWGTDEFYPWDIINTKEFRDILIKSGYDSIRATEGETIIWIVTSTKQILPDHRTIIRQALSEGKPVPAEVLKDYPELAKAVDYAETGVRLKQEYHIEPPKPLIIQDRTQTPASSIVPEEYRPYQVESRLVRNPVLGPGLTINRPEQVQPIFRHMREADREFALIIYLDTANHIVGIQEINIGTRDHALIDVEAIMRTAILTGAAGVFLAHNHPSGRPDPSDTDDDMLQQLKKAMQHLGIAVVDSFVVAAEGDTSMVSKKFLPKPRAPDDFPDPRHKVPQAKLFQKCRLAQDVKIQGKCKDKNSCAFKVSASDTKATQTISIKDLPDAIERVRKAMAKQMAGAKVTEKTTAIGPSRRRYEFRHRVIDAKDLIVSHDPFTFQKNPDYPEDLQPRRRERAAQQLQVAKIAAELDPEVLLLDFHSIEKGSPIVGPVEKGGRYIVECGNGRVIAIRIAAKEHPANAELYKMALKEAAAGYGLEVPATMELPVLVRERLTETDRKAFAEECNASTTIQSSAVEKARTDASKLTLDQINLLEVGDDESLEAALRSQRNKNFIVSFLNKIPQEEQAQLVDSKGVISAEGIRRIVLAMFVKVFPGDTGLTLAEKFFEAVDDDPIKNVSGGIAKSLGVLARSESLTAKGDRYPSLAIGQDLAKTVSVMAAIKRLPGMDVPKYIAQAQLFERELTPFQERMLVDLDSIKRSGKKVAGVLRAYADAVIASPSPAQAGMFGGAEPSKEKLWEAAMSEIKQTAEVACPGLVCLAQPGEMARFINRQGKLATAILKHPSGRYGIVGSVPYELTEEYTSGFTKGRKSKVWNTEQEVIDALLGIGVTHFQRADCSWYDKPDVKPKQCAIPPSRELKRVERAPYNFVLYSDGEIRISYSGQFIPTPSEKLMHEARAVLDIKPVQARLFQSYGYLVKKLDKCNLESKEAEKALAYKPLRELIEMGMGSGAKIQLCRAGFVPGSYQVTLIYHLPYRDGAQAWADTVKRVRAFAAKGKMKEVHVQESGQLVFQAVIPEYTCTIEDLLSGKQFVPETAIRGEKGEQAKMFRASCGGCAALLAKPRCVRTPQGTVGRVLEVQRSPKRIVYRLDIPGKGVHWVHGRVYDIPCPPDIAELKGISLTGCERREGLGVALERCVVKVKEKGGAKNPYAVCRAVISKPVCGSRK